MAIDTNRQKLVHLHSAVVKAPEGVLNKGEIAVQYATEDPALYIEKVDGTLAKFVDQNKVESLIGSAISASTEDYIATQAMLTEELGSVSESLSDLSGVALTNIIVNSVTGNVQDGVASVTIDSDDVMVGANITYSGNTLIGATANTTQALQTLADKIKTIDGIVGESNHGHDNKAVLDGITAEKVEAWDGAVSELEDKVDKVEGKGLSTNDFTNADKDKLASIAASADTNVIETVKVNGTALTVDDKAVNILVAEGTANGTLKVNGVDINVHGLGSAAYENKNAFDASGAAETAKSELIGDMTGATKTLGGLEDRIDALTTGSNVTITDSATTEGYLKSYTFEQNGQTIGVINIPKDLVVTSGQIVEVNNVKYLRLTIANQSEPVDIAVSDLVDVYTQGNGIEISNANEISAKVVAGNGLSLDANGIAMAAASSASAGAMSSADFDKLAGIASGAQVNVIDGVQVNGADLTPDANKKVNVSITAGTNNGTIAVNGSDVAVTGLGSAAYEDKSAFDASGAAEAARVAAVDSAVTAVVGDMTGATKTLGALQDAIEALDLGDKNVIEGVQVNGADLTVSNKKVNVTVAEGTTDGTIAVNGTDVAVHGLGSAAYEDTTAFDAAGAAGAASAAAITSANQYTDTKVASYVSAATGDTLVSATVSGNEVQVGATQALTNAVTAANASVQGIETGKESGAALNANRELDFTSFGIDCGTY